MLVTQEADVTGLPVLRVLLCVWCWQLSINLWITLLTPHKLTLSVNNILLIYRLL